MWILPQDFVRLKISYKSFSKSHTFGSSAQVFPKSKHLLLRINNNYYNIIFNFQTNSNSYKILNIIYMHFYFIKTRIYFTHWFYLLVKNIVPLEYYRFFVLLNLFEGSDVDRLYQYLALLPFTITLHPRYLSIQTCFGVS